MKEDSKIIKNTFFLYIRMFFNMIVAFYSSRIILEALGVSDFGIYNLVGGIVTIFTFLQNALTGATSSYFSYYLGKNDEDILKSFFSNAVLLHIILMILFILLGEVIGMYFLDKIIKIPIGRYHAAMWVFQFSIFTAAINIITLPYNSLIIAHEKMGFYALQGVLKSILILSISFIILYFGGDRLIFYSFLLCLVSIVLFILNILYIRKNYNYSIKFNLEKKIVLPLINFFKWDLYGNFSFAVNNQGIGLVLNVFFGAVINAVIGIANQVNTAVNVFISSFMMAVKPQIIKAYAKNEFDRMQILVEQLTKFSFYLILLIALPILFKLETLLSLWLNKVPENTREITFLIIIGSFFNVFILPFGFVIHATGKMKRISFISGTFYLLVIPISYLLLKVKNHYLIPFIINLIALLFVSLNNIYTAKKYVPSMNLIKFTKKALIPMLCCLLISLFFGFCLNYFLFGSLVKDLSMIFLLTIFNLGILFTIGLSKSEKELLLITVKNRFSKL